MKAMKAFDPFDLVVMSTQMIYKIILTFKWKLLNILSCCAVYAEHHMVLTSEFRDEMFKCGHSEKNFCTVLFVELFIVLCRVFLGSDLMWMKSDYVTIVLNECC